jgi:hypothetical protein
MTDEFEPGAAQPEFDVFALRTFNYSIEHQTAQLGETIGWWDDGLSRAYRSPVQHHRGSDWEDGTCEATCRSGHQAPHEGCHCGIYGSLSYAGLLLQYPQARHLVTVIAAEGTTIIGTRGLRTQFARVVAYWADVIRPDEAAEWSSRLFLGQPPSPLPGRQPSFRELARKQFKGSEEFECPTEMVERYGLSLLPPAGGGGPTWA